MEIHLFHKEYIYKWWSLDSYVSLPECSINLVRTGIPEPHDFPPPNVELAFEAGPGIGETIWGGDTSMGLSCW